MVIFLVICLVLLALYFIFGKKRVSASSGSANRQVEPLVPGVGSRPEKSAGSSKQKRVRIWERKTFVKGRLLAKFNGEPDLIKSLQQFVRERYFDITLCDARIENALFRKNNEGPFPEVPEADTYPGPIEPNPLPCAVTYEGISGTFAVLLQDVKLSNIDFNKYRLLHMEEDGLVFGMMEATITGYMLEEFREECEVPAPDAGGVVSELETMEMEGQDGTAQRGGIVEPVPVLTGRSREQSGYQWQEVKRANGEMTMINPIYTHQHGIGCGGVIGFIGLVFLFFVFLSAIGPEGILVLLLCIAVGLLVAFFSGLFRPLIWLLAGVMVVCMVASLTSRVANGPVKREVPFSRDGDGERSFVVRKRTVHKDSVTDGRVDSLVIHHRVWKDFSDSTYEGDVWVRSADVSSSGVFKNQLVAPGDPLTAYDRMLDALWICDSNKLSGVYRLLDSIRVGRRLGEVRFAEVVVSFVQDIPYALILDGDCNPDLYADAFTRRYLESADASCLGYQRFGINTPVEFVGTLKGDCDTRTLLLFTLLQHYGYDVAILSSEVYSHSLLGIVEPLEGSSYLFHGKRYVLWETTAPNMPPGIIGTSIRDLSNWRISLTSKYGTQWN
jgi:hypothetical protein